MKKKSKQIIEKVSAWNRKHAFISSVLASIVASLIMAFLGYIFAVKPVQELGSDFKELTEIVNTNFSSIQSQFDNQNKQIAMLRTDLDTQIFDIQNEFSEYKTEINNVVNSQMDNNNSNNSNVTILNQLQISPDLLNAISSTYNTDQDVFSSSEKCQFINKDATLLTNKDTNEIYTVGDLNDETLILHYTDDNAGEVFFKGQYNEDGFWDGKCVINRYIDGNLALIMDAEYDSGELICYKQIFSYEKSFLDSTYEVWAIAERQKENNEYSGFTWTYFKQGEYEQKFDSDLVTFNDILTVDDFKEHIPLLCEGYYSGYTSNGYYNDSTGHAYLVKFNEYGFVRYFYVGRIVNGQAHDKTGNAWSISWGYDNQNYYYYSGVFEKGQHMGEKPKKVSVDEIQSIYIDPNDYQCELKWINNV